MASPLLDLTNSEGFRKKLLTRNLTPYAKAPNRPTQPIDTEYVQSNSSVQDSPDKLIDEPSFANKLFPLNQYGNEGGYKQVPDPGALLNTKSNEGEYGYQDANIVGQSLPESQKWKPLNVFSNGSEVALDGAEFFGSLNRPVSTNTQNNQPYPTTFVSSTYTPVSILLSQDPGGSNGLLSQDSFIARLGAQTLRREFRDRIAAQIRQDTLGRANILNVSSGTDIVNILTGVVPIIEPVYTITVTANPILAATNFALRLGGSILPVSPIPGSYFDPNTTLGQPTTIQQISNAFRRSGVGKFFNRLMGGGETGSQIMFNNMGAGQRSQLFKNIDFNRYKPNFPRNFFQRLGGALVGTVSDNSNFYVGSITSNPSQVFSPVGDVPVNQFGVEQQSPVYGPSELAQLYEGPSQSVRLGANGPTYSNGGGIEGGFTWVSPKYRGNAGKKVGINGEITEQDEDFRPSSYVNTESVNNEFRQGSILDDTQRLIDSQPQGGKRLQHVGNAIDQVSKVFNDGYKELTKGSRVYRYVGAIGQEVGTEYCRVFAKDLPYLQYNDLQKTDGITTEGRRFAYSVLDKTYNLNIAPNKQEGGQDSTNIVGDINNAVAKKYMFSLENLAWRTSSTPGFSTSDLPVCERGPNGGRVMWFPPYGLTFSESVSTSWQASDFLGRPEPIYTYKNTSRGGQLSWQIVVDHPSILNVIVNKVLSNETNKTRIDSILESFFAGCRKYDVYELAKKYVTINPNDLFELQQVISSKEMTREQIIYTRTTLESGAFSPGSQAQPLSQEGSGGNTDLDFKKYLQLGFYFGNDYPKPDTQINYTQEYTRYTSSSNRQYYDKQSNAEETSTFFNTVVTPNYEAINQFAIELGKQLDTNKEGSVTILIDSSCSAPATVAYNKELSKRRIDAMIKYFTENPATSKFVTSSRLMVKPNNPQGEIARSTPMKSSKTEGPYPPEVFSPNGTTFSCSDEATAGAGDTQVGANEIFTVGAMACRRAYISNIQSTLNNPQSGPNGEGTPGGQTNPTGGPGPIIGLTGTLSATTETIPILTPEWKPKDNITKKVVRALLTECDYFEVIKETTPMVFDNLKDKLKFFQPSFHSITPEGLNSRLTFLQQCMRPGDTIPTIKSDGETQTLNYNKDASNTSFGAPPVLVLRIGDFYNTKIIPDGLNISYEGLDLNPEGIGVQPMIATISLQFKFVGGSGLKESVDKLQNALTFNYYANTEIYDDRADVTDIESSRVLDQIFLEGQIPPPIPGANSAAPNNGQDNNSTIGNIVSNVTDTSGNTTGVLSYSTFMKKVVGDTQTYFTNVVNKTKESVNQYNNAVRQQWMLERNYTKGNFEINSENVILFGKPNNVEKRFDTIFGELVKNIKDDQEGFIEYISEKSKNLSPKLIRAIKENYSNFVSRKRGSFENAISTITQSLVNEEQSYLQTLGRLNTILYSPVTGNTGTDGLQAKNGPVTIYVTSGTADVHNTSFSPNTYLELVRDTLTIQEDIKKFNTVIERKTKFIYPANSTEYEGILVFKTENGKSNAVSVQEVFNPFSKNPLFGNQSFRRVYMIVSDDVLDEKKYETFKQEIIGNVLGNKALLGDGSVDIEAIFDTYWIRTARPIFLEENNITKSFIENLEKNDLKNYLIYTPFDLNKQRNFTFTSIDPSGPSEKKTKENLIKGLANTTNQNTNVLTWNDLNDNLANAYISKAKLN